MAPEVVQKKVHNYKVDIWSLGVLLYELLHGYAPFKGFTNDEKFKSILENQIKFEVISPEAKDLITRLLKSNPEERPEFNVIFEHPWLKKFEKELNMDIKRFIYQPNEKKRVDTLDTKREINPLNNSPQDQCSENFSSSQSQLYSPKNIYTGNIESIQAKSFFEKISKPLSNYPFHQKEEAVTIKDNIEYKIYEPFHTKEVVAFTSKDLIVSPAMINHQNPSLLRNYSTALNQNVFYEDNSRSEQLIQEISASLDKLSKSHSPLQRNTDNWKPNTPQPPSNTDLLKENKRKTFHNLPEAKKINNKQIDASSVQKNDGGLLKIITMKDEFLQGVPYSPTQDHLENKKLLNTSESLIENEKGETFKFEHKNEKIIQVIDTFQTNENVSQSFRVLPESLLENSKNESNIELNPKESFGMGAVIERNKIDKITNSQDKFVISPKKEIEFREKKAEINDFISTYRSKRKTESNISNNISLDKKQETGRKYSSPMKHDSIQGEDFSANLTTSVFVSQGRLRNEGFIDLSKTRANKIIDNINNHNKTSYQTFLDKEHGVELGDQENLNSRIKEKTNDKTKDKDSIGKMLNELFQNERKICEKESHNTKPPLDSSKSIINSGVSSDSKPHRNKSPAETTPRYEQKKKNFETQRATVMEKYKEKWADLCQVKRQRDSSLNSNILFATISFLQ